MKTVRSDEAWMRVALKLAARGEGWTRPNPCVGAVLVRNNRCLGRGFHRKAGGPHAEIEAIRDALSRGHRLEGATLYVTLEPCCTHGRTPPCTEAILRHRLGRVVVGATDPNPRHAGRAYAILKKAGVAVTFGVLAGECAALNRSFNHWISTGRPWVVAKVAMTLDGALRAPNPQRKWLTGPVARRQVHRLRAGCDAILVGAGTVRADDPRLDVRGVRCLRQPFKVVVTKSGNIPKKARVLRPASLSLIYRNRPWKAVWTDLGRRGVTKVLVEGGGQILDSLAREGWINEVWIYYAPLVAGEAVETLPRAERFRKMSLSGVTVEAAGRDLLLRGFVS
jgi:diaminohydroxyphosphoribosylaminopyrimidine deaminase/5-amino-6-(5-phosphoribosylamino)uracil reductase